MTVSGQELNGRIALVTGGGGDLGRGIARRLHASGALVVIADINREAAEETAVLIGQQSNTVCATDITNSAAVRDMFDTVTAQFGAVDILVNNAGDIRDALLPDMSEADWDFVVDLNLKGAFLCAQAAYRSMVERKSGRIINISSMSYKGNIGQANYASAKAGIVGLTKALGLELARHNITVNCVAPGIIDTPKAKTLSSRTRDRLVEMTPMRRLGKIEDIANSVHFFATDQSNYITRQVIHVSGGMEGF